MDFYHHMVQELKAELLSGRIQKLINLSSKNWYSKSEAIGKTKTLTLCPFCFGRIQRTQTNFENPAFPNTFIMVMRKYLQGAVIEGIEQLENDRILEIRVSNKTKLEMPFLSA